MRSPDHACTRSNRPGQPGSVYGGVPASAPASGGAGPRILALAGRAGEGKDTLCALLAGLRPAGATRRVALADPLKVIARDLWDLTDAQVHGALKDVRDERWGVTPRDLCRIVGMAGRAGHPDTWVRLLLRQVDEAYARAAPQDRPRLLWVVTDVRFHNEVAGLRAAGAVVWRVRRHAPPTEAELAAMHPSEAAVDQLQVDRVVENRGSMDDLERAAADALRSLEPWPGARAPGP